LEVVEEVQSRLKLEKKGLLVKIEVSKLAISVC